MVDRAALLKRANELGLELEITRTASGVEYTIRCRADDTIALTDLMGAIDAVDPEATYALPWATGTPAFLRWAE